MLVLLLFTLGINAQITLKNKDNKGNFPKIIIGKTRTSLYDVANQGTRLWLFWDQVPKKDANCKDYGHCYHMTVYSSDHLANRTFYIKYSKPFKEPRYENPIFTGVMKATFMYKDGRPTKTITEYFTEVK